MNAFGRTSAWARTVALSAALSAALCFAGSGQTQAPGATAMHITTQERLETEPWWPTMANAPLAAYTGSNECLVCHTEQHPLSPTAMQRAATRAADAHVLTPSTHTTFTSAGFSYSLLQDGNTLQLSATIGNRKAVQNMDWSVGAGDLARTFLYKENGRWYQSEASFYTKLAALDITTGFGAKSGASPAGALGNILSPEEARSCFGCHTVHATTSAGLDPVHAEAGIGCEACHGPGRKHVESMTASQGSDKLGASKSEASDIFQPAKLSPSDSIDFCGSCHRSVADASLSTGPQADRAVVRFQPYRLEESKCWRATKDERLTCVACHDPHKPLIREAASYDRNCLQCHFSQTHATAVCPKATHDCVTCHMPKVELPSMHGTFTDHFIRIAREGDPLPR